jgi:AcrR family transcriptional regulator
LKARGQSAGDTAVAEDNHLVLGRREAGKSERRRRIIEAARGLIRETGNPGLSMRALAARAGVSLATPYNLFGSKRAIVLAVLEDVRQFQERFANVRVVDPVERIFSALELAVSFYTDDPRFYKTLWAAVFDTTDEVHSDIFNPQRNAFWEKLVVEAQQAGAVLPEVDCEVLVRELDFIQRSALYGWVVGEIEEQLLAPTVFCGYALILKAAATQGWQGPLQARFLDSQRRLKRKSPSA